MIYLNNLQKGREDRVEIKDVIFSEKYAEKSFNIEIQDRLQCIDALYNNREFNPLEKVESVRNLVNRYNDVEDIFPTELKEKALPFFIDWLIDNVIFVEIKTYSDDDAYLIFETMNDRGLNLSPTEMLEGYLLSHIDEDNRVYIDEIWRKKIFLLKETDKDEDLEFFRGWLRSKYAITIRQSKEGAENEDFEIIGTRFHSWVRDNDKKIGLNAESDFLPFIKEQFGFYSDLYVRIIEAANSPQKGVEYIHYLESLKFARSFYAPLLMAPVDKNDTLTVIKQKLALVGRFLETFVVFRRLNNRTTNYASIRYTMYTLMKDIRNMEVSELGKLLKNKVDTFEETLNGMNDFGLNQQNKKFIQFLLARITSYMEQECGMASSFNKYFDRQDNKPFEIEHIWPNKYDLYEQEFKDEEEFREIRNRLGDLILVPNGFNQSYGGAPYETKIVHYYGQNLLAQSLSSNCYQKNPSFIRFIEKTRLPFKPYEYFTKKEIEERQMLYQKICERIWNTEVFDSIIESSQ